MMLCNKTALSSALSSSSTTVGTGSKSANQTSVSLRQWCRTDANWLKHARRHTCSASSDVTMDAKLLQASVRLASDLASSTQARMATMHSGGKSSSGDDDVDIIATMGQWLFSWPRIFISSLTFSGWRCPTKSDRKIFWFNSASPHPLLWTTSPFSSSRSLFASPFSFSGSSQHPHIHAARLESERPCRGVPPSTRPKSTQDGKTQHVESMPSTMLRRR